MAEKRVAGSTVTAENVGGIDETRVRLASGVTVLAGRNATDRTSLLLAIMALGSDVRPLKADAESGRVELHVDGDRFIRTLDRKGDHVVAGGDPYLDDPGLVGVLYVLERNEARQAVERGDELRELIMRPVDTEEIQRQVDQAVAERARIEVRTRGPDREVVEVREAVGRDGRQSAVEASDGLDRLVDGRAVAGRRFGLAVRAEIRPDRLIRDELGAEVVDVDTLAFEQSLSLGPGRPVVALHAVVEVVGVQFDRPAAGLPEQVFQQFDVEVVGEPAEAPAILFAAPPRLQFRTDPVEGVRFDGGRDLAPTSGPARARRTAGWKVYVRPTGRNRVSAADGRRVRTAGYSVQKSNERAGANTSSPTARSSPVFSTRWASHDSRCTESYGPSVTSSSSV